MSNREFIRRFEELEENNGVQGTQTHVHEFEGSVEIAEREEDPHNHRFAGVSSEEIPVPGGHVHAILTKTDFYENHFHEVSGTSGLQIPVGDGRHVHFASGTTTLNDGHVHQFRFAALINDPIGEDNNNNNNNNNNNAH